MWPLEVLNPEFLLTIYGHYPHLDNVEIIEATLNRDGPNLTLRLTTTSLPYRPPQKWSKQGKFNRIHFELKLGGIKQIRISSFKSHGFTDLRMWNDDGEINFMCDGAFRAELRFSFLCIARITPLLVHEEDDH